jgi:hypothetical protein
VYYSYAYNWLSYGAILWANSTDAPSLFILQKKLIRILANIKQTDSCKDYFKQYNILTLPCIYILEICKFVRKHPEFYTKREDVLKNRIMRHKGKLMLPSSRLKLHSSGPLVMSIKIYNKLPDELKDEKKETLFIHKLKQFLLSKTYYSLKEYLDDKYIDRIK